MTPRPKWLRQLKLQGLADRGVNVRVGRFACCVALLFLTPAGLSERLGPPAGAARVSRAVVPPPFGHGELDFWIRWNQWSDGFLVFRSSATRGETAIKRLDRRGRPVVSLRPVDDLHRSDIGRVSIWDAIIRADGGVSYAAVAFHGPPDVRQPRVSHFIVHYGLGGTVRDVWDMYPYHHHLLGSDGVGNVYAFGHRLDGNKGTPYPLLLRYTKAGRVARALVTASDVGAQQDPAAFVEGAPHELVSQVDGVVLWLSGRNELLDFRGDAVSRRLMGDLFDPRRAAALLSRARLSSLIPRADGRGVVARASNIEGAGPERPAFVRIMPGLDSVDVVRPSGAEPAGQLLFEDRGQFWFAQVESDGSVTLEAWSRPR